jgi:hypothetical protein
MPSILPNDTTSGNIGSDLSGPDLLDDLDLNGFDITGAGFSLNGLNEKTQNITAVSGTTSLTGGLVVTGGNEQIYTS